MTKKEDRKFNSRANISDRIKNIQEDKLLP